MRRAKRVSWRSGRLAASVAALLLGASTPASAAETKIGFDEPAYSAQSLTTQYQAQGVQFGPPGCPGAQPGKIQADAAALSPLQVVTFGSCTFDVPVWGLTASFASPQRRVGMSVRLLQGSSASINLTATDSNGDTVATASVTATNTGWTTLSVAQPAGETARIVRVDVGTNGYILPAIDDFFFGEPTTGGGGGGGGNTTIPLPPEPVAAFSGPVSAARGARVTFDASGTSAFGRALYDWDVNSDGRTDARCLNGQIEMSTRFSSFGTRQVALTVTDSLGRTGTTRRAVTVTAAAARAAAGTAPRPDDAFVCQRPRGLPIEDLTPDHGPPAVCATSVQFGLVDAIGCFTEVNSPSDIPAPERSALETRAFGTSLARQRDLGGSSPLAASARLRADPVRAAVRQHPYVATGPVQINGVDIVPRPGAAVLLVPGLEYVVSSRAFFRFEGIRLTCPEVCAPFVQYLPATFRSVEIGDLAAWDERRIGGLQFLGLRLLFAQRSSIVHMWLKVPVIDRHRDEITADARATSTNATGLQLEGATMTGISGRAGALSVQPDLAFGDGGAPATYHRQAGHDVWRGRLDVKLPSSLGERDVPAAEFVLRDGQLTTLQGSALFGLADFLDFSLKGPFSEYRLYGEFLGLDGRFLFGNIGYRSPFVASPDHVDVTAEGEFTTHLREWDDVGSRLADYEVQIRHAQALLSQESTGTYLRLVDADIDESRFVGYFFVRQATISGDILPGAFAPTEPVRVGGHVWQDLSSSSPSGFLLSGVGSGCFVGTGICSNNVGVEVSTQGAEACFTPWNGNSARVGAFRKWGQPAQLVLGTCDYGYRGAAFGSKHVRAAQGAKSLSVALPPGLSATAIAVRGSGSAPLVQVRGPHGASVTTPADGVTHNERFFAIRSSADNTAYVLINRPSGGPWAVTPLPGSAPITRIDSGNALPRPLVHARVVGAGTRRTLRYSIRPIAGQRVRFALRGAGLDLPLGYARNHTGAMKLIVPAIAPRRLHVVAAVEQNGRPRATLTVAALNVLRRIRLRAPHVRVRRHRTGLIVTWRRVPGATAYLVRTLLSDGRRQTEVTARPRAVVPDVAAGLVGAVEVTALTRSGAAGGRGRVRVTARSGPRPRGPTHP